MIKEIFEKAFRFTCEAFICWMLAWTIMIVGASIWFDADILMEISAMVYSQKFWGMTLFVLFAGFYLYTSVLFSFFESERIRNIFP